MPFKIRLKKSRQYNVVSKSLFVICIELLDSSSTECTLTSESTGRECLDNVCQRLGLQQTEFFGLRYISKNNLPRWIELERPLKRQLDKYARDNSLYLRVMYYVTTSGLIQDEMTRYHYFLQLKNDVIEGRIQCNVDEAVILASYCMQAEFGNYNIERHTTEYLKDFALFPKDLIENGFLERLTDAVIQQHSALVGLPQGTAEEYYISAAQQLDGYGQETFLVKNEHGLETILGITLKGIVVSNENSLRFFKWYEIVNVINHKKNFGIECQGNESIVNFIFPDVESAKYVWRMCVHQHTFYMQYEQNDDDSESIDTLGKANSTPRASLFQNVDTALLSSREELDEPPPPSSHVRLMPTNATNSREDLDMNERTHSNLDLVENNQDLDRLRSLLPSYRPAPDYETAIQQKYKSDQMYSSQPEIHSFPDVTQHYQHRNVLHTYSTPDLEKQMYMLHVFKAPPPYPISNSTPDLASQSTPDLAVTNTNPNIHLANTHNFITQVSGSSPDLVSSRSLSQQYIQQQHYPETYRTYANLANILTQQQHPHTKLYEDKQMMYHHYLNNNNGEANNMLIEFLKSKSNHDASRMAAAAAASTNRIPNSTLKAHEPIYENVPLPWQQSNKSGQTSSNNQTHMNSQMNPNSYVNITNNSKEVQRTNSIEAQSRKSSVSSTNKVEFSRNERQASDRIVQTNLNLNKIEIHIDDKKQVSIRNVDSNMNRNITNTDGVVIKTPPSVHESVSMPHVNNDKKNKINNDNDFLVTKVQVDSKKDQINKVKETSINDSNVSFDSTSSTNTVDKKAKKKWSGFLSGGGSSNSSKSKSNTLTKQEEKHKLLTKKTSIISKETMCQILEQKLSDQQLFFEFEKIPKVPKHNPDFSSAINIDNINRNRFKDVLPYEENRVRITPKRDNRLGYINASHITATVGNDQRFYIAAQSPLVNTIESFWDMIWESNVYLVINLTDTSETNVKYIPDSKSNRTLDIGEFRISKELIQETGHCITGKFNISHPNTKRTRSVWHLQYTNWDGSDICPKSVSHFLGFLEEVSSIREYIVTEIPCGHNKNPPILINCLDGVEKTGLAILCDLLLYMLDHNEEVDVPRILLSLRNQRMKIISNLHQYNFVHNLLVYYLKHSRLI